MASAASHIPCPLRIAARTALLALTITTFAACGSPAGSSNATTSPTVTRDPRCARTGSDGQVVGTFAVRAGDLADQDETPRGGATGPRPLRSGFRDYPPDTPILLCFFDGGISAPGGGPPGPGSSATFRPYDRYLVLVDPSGKARLFAAGHADTMVVAPRLP